MSDAAVSSDMTKLQLSRNVAAAGAGLLFGLGVTISQMTNPAKVLAFFDFLGGWDPSLAFVMGGGLITTAIGFRYVLRAEKPRFDEKFNVPTNTIIDRPLVIGAVLFGIGWGLAGLCPGPAVASLVIGGSVAWLFFAAMLLGMWLHQQWAQKTGS